MTDDTDTLVEFGPFLVHGDELGGAAVAAWAVELDGREIAREHVELLVPDDGLMRALAGRPIGFDQVDLLPPTSPSGWPTTSPSRADCEPSRLATSMRQIRPPAPALPIPTFGAHRTDVVKIGAIALAALAPQGRTS